MFCTYNAAEITAICNCYNFAVYVCIYIYIYICWMLPSNYFFGSLLRAKGWVWLSETWTVKLLDYNIQQNSYMTLIGVNLNMHLMHPN